jgi:peroxiredoxin-like protein
MEAHYYNVNLNWTSGRKGKISSPELDNSIKVATPPEFPKGIEGIWSPEHLLTASVVSCFMTTFLSIAENSKLEFSTFDCKAKGKLENIEGKLLMTEIILEPTLVINKDTNIARAERVLQKSEAACLISNSIKSKVTMIPTIKIAELTY